MKKQMIVAIFTVVLSEIFILSLGGPMDKMSLGLSHLVISIIVFFVGLVLVFIQKTRHYGEGILLGTGLLLLSGLFICSI